jgi:hypothetical protein
MIPTKTRLLIHFDGQNDARRLSTIQQALPTHATVVSFSDLDTDGLVPREVLADALASAKSTYSASQAAPASAIIATAAALVKEGVKSHPGVDVVDWTGHQMITLTQRPIDPRSLFSPQKTYLLMGLSGQIGQSMCRWMVENGARHIVVTSRYVQVFENSTQASLIITDIPTRKPSGRRSYKDKVPTLQSRQQMSLKSKSL